MAELTRHYRKIFANTGPTGLVGQFGSFKGGTAEYSLDPDTLQGLTAFDQGWQYAGLTNNVPSVEDFNCLGFLFSRQQAYLKQSGVPEWNSSTTYYMNSIVTDGLGNIYASLQDDNLNNALTDAAYWFFMHGRSYTGIGTGYTASNTDYIINWSATGGVTGTCVIWLPAAASNLKGRKYILIAGHPSIGVTGPSCTINAPADGPWSAAHLDYRELIEIICDGTNWYYKLGVN